MDWQRFFYKTAIISSRVLNNHGMGPGIPWARYFVPGVTGKSVPLSSVLQRHVSPPGAVGPLEKMVECHFLLCLSAFISLVSAIFSPLGSQTQLGILGISALADRMIVSTAAVSKKSSRTCSNTHTHTHQTCFYMSCTHVNSWENSRSKHCMP